MIDNYAGRHLIGHYRDYSAFYDNCQPFALNVLATSILCSSCGEPGEPPGPTNAYCTLFSMTHLRRQLLEAGLFALVIKFIVIPLYQPSVFCFILVPLSSITLIFLCHQSLFDGSSFPGQRNKLLSAHTGERRGHRRPGLSDYLILYKLEHYHCTECKDNEKRLQNYRQACASRQSSHRVLRRPEGLKWNILLSIPIWEEPITIACILLLIPLSLPGDFILWLITVWILASVLIVAHPNASLSRIGLAVYVLRRRTGLHPFPLLLLSSIILISVSRSRTIVWRDEVIEKQRLRWQIYISPLKFVLSHTFGRLFTGCYSRLVSMGESSDLFHSLALPSLACIVSFSTLNLLWQCRSTILGEDQLGLL